MTIIFDPIRRRSTHVESGLAVQWVRDEPPMERCTHFKLIVDGIEVPFAASYDYGEARMKKRFPDADTFELYKRLHEEVREMNYRADKIAAYFDKQLFVDVWQNLVQQGLTAFRVSTYYNEFASYNPDSGKEWGCEGQAPDPHSG